VEAEIPTTEIIIELNKRICSKSGETHFCRDSGKVDSSISTAFYPGVPPFVHGGVAGLAGALCFYLINNHPFEQGNKRTACVAAITFMRNNNWNLKYPVTSTHNSLADIVEKCAAGEVTKDILIEWFNRHKYSLN